MQFPHSPSLGLTTVNVQFLSFWIIFIRSQNIPLKLSFPFSSFFMTKRGGHGSAPSLMCLLDRAYAYWDPRAFGNIQKRRQRRTSFLMTRINELVLCLSLFMDMDWLNLKVFSLPRFSENHICKRVSGIIKILLFCYWYLYCLPRDFPYDISVLKCLSNDE